MNFRIVKTQWRTSRDLSKNIATSASHQFQLASRI